MATLGDASEGRPLTINNHAPSCKYDDDDDDGDDDGDDNDDGMTMTIYILDLRIRNTALIYDSIWKKRLKRKNFQQLRIVHDGKRVWPNWVLRKPLLAEAS